jgi:hypothetical protein
MATPTVVKWKPQRLFRGSERRLCPRKRRKRGSTRHTVRSTNRGDRKATGRRPSLALRAKRESEMAAPTAVKWKPQRLFRGIVAFRSRERGASVFHPSHGQQSIGTIGGNGRRPSLALRAKRESEIAAPTATGVWKAQRLFRGIVAFRSRERGASAVPLVTRFSSTNRGDLEETGRRPSLALRAKRESEMATPTATSMESATPLSRERKATMPAKEAQTCSTRHTVQQRTNRDDLERNGRRPSLALRAYGKHGDRSANRHKYGKRNASFAGAKGDYAHA